jgi:hypothetical protein
MTVYDKNPDYVLKGIGLDPIAVIYDLVLKGEPFELIDGDNLLFCQSTINNLF